MSSKTEFLAVQLVRALSDAPDGRPMQWRKIEQLDFATADAIEFAAARGWVQIEGGHSIALTARDRLLGLSQRGTFGGDANVIKAAAELWREAAAVVRAHSDKRP
jgi:hypothetical protein